MYTATTIDPIIIINDNILPGTSRLILKRNMCYGMLFRVVNNAKNIVFTLQKESNMSLQEFCAYVEAASLCPGLDSTSNEIEALSQLLSVAQDWKRDLLQDAETLGMSRAVRLPTLEEVLNEPPRFNTSEMEKLIAATKTMLEGASEQDINEAIQFVEQKLREEHKQRVELHSKISGPTQVVIDRALELNLHVEFYELPTSLQQQILTSLLNSLNKLPQQLAKSNQVEMTDMVMALGGIKRVRQAVELVLNDPRFAASAVEAVL